MKAQGNPTVRSYTRNDMWDPQPTTDTQRVTLQDHRYKIMMDD